jgi:hypothetical protein
LPRRIATMTKFRVEIEVEIESELTQYIGRETTTSKSLLIGLAKDQLWLDVNDAIRLYGIQGRVNNVAKVQS